MGNLGAYLRPVPAGKTKEFYLENFKDEKGEKIPFVVKAITPKENDRIVKRNTVKGVFNNATYINEMIVTCMETPNLKDATLQFLWCHGPDRGAGPHVHDRGKESCHGCGF